MMLARPDLRRQATLCLAISLLACTGCSSFHAFNARFHAPDYVVTPDFYAEAPQRTAILPFAARDHGASAQKKADVCRKVLYQQFSTREFEDFEMYRCDEVLHAIAKREEERHGLPLFRYIRRLDAVGMTSLLDLRTLVTGDPLKHRDINEFLKVTCEGLPVDATIAGVTRSYGRFYAVAASSIRLGTRVEMRSTKTGKLLWRGQHGKSNYVFPVTLNPIDIPYLLYYVWDNSRGVAMDMLAYDVYGKLVATIPYVSQPEEMFVRTLRNPTPCFGRKRVCMMCFKRCAIPAGVTMPFLLEQDGWIQCRLPDGRDSWVLKRHVELIPRPRQLINRDAVIQQLCTGFKFTEGPAADAEGNVFFTDIPNRRIHCWSTDGKLTTVRENTARANGLAFDHKGRLLACEGDPSHPALTRMSPRGKVKPVVTTFDGKPLNSPNDLWIAPNHGIYFTDPRYGKNKTLSQDGENVYYLPPNRRKIVRVANDLVRPNGIVGTRCGRTLYVTDHGDNKTYRYRISRSGVLTDKALFCEYGSDGMALDEFGNLYLTTEKLRVFNPDGKEILALDIPEKPSNVAFGGKDRRILFVTARTSLYAIETNVRGL